MGQLHASLPDRRDRAVTSRICAALRAQIADGVYAPGARLPSTRALAAELGVSRTTVTAAYDQLAAEGYLETRRGARARVPDGVAAGRRPPPREAAAAPAGLSRFAERLAALPADDRPAARAPVADFRYGDLSSSDFPTAAWKRATAAAILRRAPRLSYGDPAGSPELRAALRGYLWRARGLRCDLEQVVVVNGSQQGLDLCVRLLLDPGERAVVEDPCYVAARELLTAAGAEVVPVGVDEEGLRTHALPDARLAYVTPSHQYPLGGVMSARRRLELLAWARAAGAYVVEDDYDGEYRYDIAPIPTVHALDGGERVVYVGTVSKTLSPRLRLGYVVVPRTLAPLFAAAKRLADRHAPDVEQRALAALLSSGAYERHVRRARRWNAARRSALLDALRRELGEGVRIVGADAGLHLVAWLVRLPRSSEAPIAAAARAAGVGVYPVGPLYAAAAAVPDRPDHPGFVMGYASLSPREIADGVARLAAVVRAAEAETPAG